MEPQQKEESIFEQENYDGGLGSGPLAAAADEDTTTAAADEDEEDDLAGLDDEEETDRPEQAS